MIGPIAAYYDHGSERIWTRKNSIGNADVPSKSDWEVQRGGEVEALCRFEGAIIDLWRDPLRVARACRREGLGRGATGPTGVAFCA